MRTPDVRYVSGLCWGFLYRNERNNMNVMYLCNNNYAMVAGVSICSLLDHNLDIDEINIFLVADNIANGNLKRLQSIVDFYNRNLFIIPKPDMKELLECDVETHWWIDNVFSRILLGEVLKEYRFVHRLIYIDCDTLIVGSIKDLWELDLCGNIGAGVCEAMGNVHKKAIGLSKEDNYFNAGMFLVDVDRWRLENKDNAARKFIKEVRGKLEYADESVLNGILAKEMLRLSPKYNLTSLSFYFTSKELIKYRKSYINYTEEERIEALNDARIVHFTSTYLDVRPWVEGCRHPYTEKWHEYKEKTPWKNQELRKDNRTIVKRIARKAAILMPKQMRLLLTGLVHAYIKPLKYMQ